jgi:hypothetical protein
MMKKNSEPFSVEYVSPKTTYKLESQRMDTEYTKNGTAKRKNKGIKEVLP